MFFVDTYKLYSNLFHTIRNWNQMSNHLQRTHKQHTHTTNYIFAMQDNTNDA